MNNTENRTDSLCPSCLKADKTAGYDGLCAACWHDAAIDGVECGIVREQEEDMRAEMADTNVVSAFDSHEECNPRDLEAMMRTQGWMV